MYNDVEPDAKADDRYSMGKLQINATFQVLHLMHHTDLPQRVLVVRGLPSFRLGYGKDSLGYGKDMGRSSGRG